MSTSSTPTPVSTGAHQTAFPKVVYQPVVLAAPTLLGSGGMRVAVGGIGSQGQMIQLAAMGNVAGLQNIRTAVQVLGNTNSGNLVYLRPDQLDQAFLQSLQNNVVALGPDAAQYLIPYDNSRKVSSDSVKSSTRGLPPIVHKFKTELCRHWMQTGTCCFDTNCIYAHGEDELRRESDNLGLTIPANPSIKPPPKQQQVNAIPAVSAAVAITASVTSQQTHMSVRLPPPPQVQQQQQQLSTVIEVPAAAAAVPMRPTPVVAIVSAPLTTLETTTTTTTNVPCVLHNLAATPTQPSLSTSSMNVIVGVPEVNATIPSSTSATATPSSTAATTKVNTNLTLSAPSITSGQKSDLIQNILKRVEALEKDRDAIQNLLLSMIAALQEAKLITCAQLEDSRTGDEVSSRADDSELPPHLRELMSESLPPVQQLEQQLQQAIELQSKDEFLSEDSGSTHSSMSPQMEPVDTGFTAQNFRFSEPTKAPESDLTTY